MFSELIKLLTTVSFDVKNVSEKTPSFESVTDMYEKIKKIYVSEINPSENFQKNLADLLKNLYLYVEYLSRENTNIFTGFDFMKKEHLFVTNLLKHG